MRVDVGCIVCNFVLSDDCLDIKNIGSMYSCFVKIKAFFYVNYPCAADSGGPGSVVPGRLSGEVNGHRLETLPAPSSRPQDRQGRAHAQGIPDCSRWDQSPHHRAHPD